jgi:prepilin-type N-terminal cleavage/methylation domain-containing protein
MGRHRHAIDARGFTLLELIVTLFVVALATSLAVPAVGRSTEMIRGRAEVARFSALFRYTRDQAINTQRAHAVVLDPGEHRVSILAAPSDVLRVQPLAPDLNIVANPPTSLTVWFAPSGVSNGGDFRLTRGPLNFRVTVDPLTGRVRVDRL